MESKEWILPYSFVVLKQRFVVFSFFWVFIENVSLVHKCLHCIMYSQCETKHTPNNFVLRIEMFVERNVTFQIGCSWKSNIDMYILTPVIQNTNQMVSSSSVSFLAIFKKLSVVLNTFPVEFSDLPFIHLSIERLEFH
jgi:hypothetical protein